MCTSVRQYTAAPSQNQVIQRHVFEYKNIIVTSMFGVYLRFILYILYTIYILIRNLLFLSIFTQQKSADNSKLPARSFL